MNFEIIIKIETGQEYGMYRQQFYSNTINYKPTHLPDQYLEKSQQIND